MNLTRIWISNLLFISISLITIHPRFSTIRFNNSPHPFIPHPLWRMEPGWLYHHAYPSNQNHAPIARLHFALDSSRGREEGGRNTRRNPRDGRMKVNNCRPMVGETATGVAGEPATGFNVTVISAWIQPWIMDYFYAELHEQELPVSSHMLLSSTPILQLSHG